MPSLSKNQKIIILALLIIILGAIFVRTYNFHDWLFFKFDQARDAILISKAINNSPMDLPLLGPRATKVGNDYLRLGPAYYYFQYFSGVIFSSTKPDIFAYPDIFFSILVIPLLYFFFRLYFSRLHSLLGTLLYAFSFLIIQYSRFSWNPNAVPFFTLATFYGMLSFFRAKEFRKKLLWISVWAFSLAIASQLHFFAFFTLVGVSVLFFFFRLKLWKLKTLGQRARQLVSKNVLKYIGVVMLIFLIIYTPVIISDAKTSGSNTKNFFLALKSKPKEKTFSEKFVRNFREQAKGYFLITTSFDHRKGKKADPIPVTAGLALIFSGIILAIYGIKKTKSQNKKDFLILLIIWMGVFLVVCHSVSYQLRPRYFVPIFPIPFIILCLWFDLIKAKTKKYSLVIILASTLFFLILNIYGISKWFEEQKLSQIKSVPIDKTLILKRQDGVTLGQLERIVDYMTKNKGNETIVYNAKSEYTLPIEYLALQQKETVELVKSSKDLIDKDVFFSVTSVRGGENSISEKISGYSDIISSKQFGQLMIYTLKVDQQKISQVKEAEAAILAETNQEEVDNPNSGKTPRLFWEDVFEN
jgi:Dolichyl-phosphate-mannose-protein mannosyltransferase